jgi:WD40 repeat protein
VLTASDDGTARLWDAATSKELAVLLDHVGAVSSALFSPSETRVLIASSNMTAGLENFRTTQELVDRACQIMPRPLTPKQRKLSFLDDTPKAWPCGWNPSEAQKPPYVAKAAH